MLQGQWLKPIVLQIVIEIDLQALKHNADVTMMSETLIRTHKVELLTIHLTESGQYIHLHLPLLCI